MTELPTAATEGIPLLYSPHSDDTVAAVLLGCFFLSSYVLSRSRSFLFQLVKDFLLHRERTSIFATATAGDMRCLLALIFQTCVLAGIFFLDCFNDTGSGLAARVPPALLLLVYIGFCLAYLLLKWVVYSFLGWIFFDGNLTSLWLGSYCTLLYYLGLSLFPFVLSVVYLDISLSAKVTVGLSVLVFVKILTIYKWKKLFCNNLHGCFLLILYFCALEIVPCIMLYEGMVKLNNL